MDAQQIKSIFEKKSENYDRKHINNLAASKAIPQNIIDRLRVDGLTIEDIESLSKKGYPICKYATQITVHGVCKKLESNRSVGGYVSLVLNQNKSIGVRWIAIDGTKRNEIEMYVRNFGWSRFQDSTSDYFQMTKSYTKENVDEFLAIAKRIDTSLFFGNCYVFSFSMYFRNYVAIKVVPFGIYQKNVENLISQMAGVPFSEAKEVSEKAEAEKRKKIDERNRMLELENEKIKNEKEEWKKSNPMPKGFEKVGSLNEGDIVCFLREFYSRCEWIYEIVYKAGGHLCAKRCDESGKPTEYRGHRIVDGEWFVKRNSAV